jgi:NADP-dependent 3-hydroxy acid dehydrogenase YdfG
VKGAGNRPPVGIVTGAASGIGAATTVEFARLEARMILASLPSDDLEPVAEAAWAAGGDAVPLSLHVRDDERVALSRIALRTSGGSTLFLPTPLLSTRARWLTATRRSGDE